MYQKPSVIPLKESNPCANPSLPVETLSYVGLYIEVSKRVALSNKVCNTRPYALHICWPPGRKFGGTHRYPADIHVTVYTKDCVSQ